MTSKLLIVSNNPLVWNSSELPCLRVEGSALAVLYACLGFLGEEKGILFAHPMAGNARLIHNPFRTVVLQEKEKPSPDEIASGIGILEYFIRKMEDLGGAAPEPTHGDYGVVDHGLFLAMLPADARAAAPVRH